MLMMANTFIAELKTANPVIQQGMTRVLGFAGSGKFPQGTQKTIECLNTVVKPSVRCVINYLERFNHYMHSGYKANFAPVLC